jgi:2-dehydropantoate 2-reductase|nr:2-dehydropantoate 2-reductase N-terminal domain-containing protein [Kofleriaceae bacterium]
MNALIVGAGAVGQIYGHCLARGGARVTFLVKPKYAAEARAGFILYALGGRPRRERLDGCDVITDPREWAARSGSAGSRSVAEGRRAESIDQVYLTVASTALAGDWLPELCRATAPATIVLLQPGLDDREIVERACGDASCVVASTISFLSYHAPLPGETRFHEPGMAYWFFPLTRAPVSGPDDARVAAVIDALAAGKMPVKRAADARADSAGASALLSAFVAALEASEWSFARMRKDNAVLGARAAREAAMIALGKLPFGLKLAARPGTFRSILRLAPHLVPVDLEAYMKAHFTKVGDQMHAGLDDYIQRGRALQASTAALEDLARRRLIAQSSQS